MKKNLLYKFILFLGIMFPMSLNAADTALPTMPQEKSEQTESVQVEVAQESDIEANKKREKIIKEAVAAVKETRNALKALEENKVDEALNALEIATGKLELVLARDPGLSLAPIDVDMVTYDLLSNVNTVEAIIKQAKEYMDDGHIQKARPLLKYLASEMVFSTTSIPLATYPSAIKAITPLIDEGDLDAAKLGLRTALNTLVTVDEIIPLPIVRAERLLINAEELVEMEERTDKDNETLEALLKDAETELQLAEVLGYVTEKSIKPMYAQLKEIKKKSTGGASGKGWFDDIKNRLKDLF